MDMPTKALNIVVNRTMEHGLWIAKVKKNDSEVTIVFRQLHNNAGFFTRISQVIRGYKSATQLSTKYLEAMNLQYQNLPRNTSSTYQQRIKSKPTNEQIDEKFITASDKQDKKESILAPTRASPFIQSTSKFKLIQVDIKDEYKKQLKENQLKEATFKEATLKEQKRQKFFDELFKFIETETKQSISANEKKHYQTELMPVADLVCGCFDREQWTDDQLRFARIALNSLADTAKLEGENKIWIDRLTNSLGDEVAGINLTALKEPPPV
jgi:hypothetical protein